MYLLDWKTKPSKNSIYQETDIKKDFMLIDEPQAQV
jgi:hypothetical protein